MHGIIVHRPYRTDAGYPLKEWDVITAIGTTPIDDQGMITIGSDLRQVANTQGGEEFADWGPHPLASSKG